MKINYVTGNDKILASFRYHVETPAEELVKLGHDVFITDFPLIGCDVYVFRKHLRTIETDLIQQAKKNSPNSTTYYIVCDYHLNDKFREHYLTMIDRCDVLVVCTEAMKKILKEETGKDSVVIKDPWGVEFKEQPPMFSNKRHYDILWFGSRTNMAGLVSVMNDLKSHKVTVVTDIESGSYKIDDNEVKIVQYSKESLKDEFKKCDIVIIPQDVTQKGKLVKTHNRLVDSIRNGKFTIVSPVDAYKELGDYCYIGNIKDGLDWLSEQENETIMSMIASGQDYIRKEFSPEKIGKDWEALFEKHWRN